MQIFGLRTIVLVTLAIAVLGIFTYYFNMEDAKGLGLMIAGGFVLFYLLIAFLFFQVIYIKGGLLMILFLNPFKKPVKIQLKSIEQVTIATKFGKGLLTIQTDSYELTLQKSMSFAELKRLHQVLKEKGVKVGMFSEN